jgi:hypothetical protein
MYEYVSHCRLPGSRGERCEKAGKRLVLATGTKNLSATCTRNSLPFHETQLQRLRRDFDWSLGRRITLIVSLKEVS